MLADCAVACLSLARKPCVELLGHMEGSLMAPIKRQLGAGLVMLVILATSPLWIVPHVIWKLYRYAYIEVCGWDDF